MPRNPASWRTVSTTSCEVFPDGLSITRIPSTGGCLGVRDINVFVDSRTSAFARLRSLYRAPIASATIKMRRTIAVLRTALLGIFGLAQQVLDAIAVLFRFVENEQHFGRPPHVQALHQFVPHIPFRGLQTFQGRGA